MHIGGKERGLQQRATSGLPDGRIAAAEGRWLAVEKEEEPRRKRRRERQPTGRRQHRQQEGEDAVATIARDKGGEGDDGGMTGKREEREGVLGVELATRKRKREMGRK